jgi:sulfate permease, SulP family
VPSIANWGAPDWSNWAAVVSNTAVAKVVLFGSLTLALVGTIDTFFALQTVQYLANVAVEPRRDIIGQGIGNIVSGLAGGLVVSTSLSLTTANFRAGGRTRVSPMMSGLALLMGLLFVPFVISSLPLVVLAAILVVISIRMVDRWSWNVLGSALFAKEKSRRANSLRDGGIVLAVMLATVLGQPIAGVVLGVALSCIIFISDMSRPVVAKRRDGTVVHSKRVRSRREKDILKASGRLITTWELQGVLFFGNANNLAAELRSIQSDAKIIILDFRRVTDVDTSGMTVLQQLAVRLRAEGRQLVVCGCEQTWFNRAHTADFDPNLMAHFGTADLALDWAETRVIERFGGKVLPLELDLEESDLGRGIACEDLFVLRAHSKLIRYAAGSYLCCAGDAAEQLWIIRSGLSASGLPEHAQS